MSESQNSPTPETATRARLTQIGTECINEFLAKFDGVESMENPTRELAQWVGKALLAAFNVGAESVSQTVGDYSENYSEPTKPEASDWTRLRNLLKRLCAPGPKAAHVSASECHEILDDTFEALAKLETAQGEVQKLTQDRDRIWGRNSTLRMRIQTAEPAMTMQEFRASLRAIAEIEAADPEGEGSQS